mmetsp:Transcript_36403/g.34416  ORF Transcript_36403/g.34416 Transcript_36403/m.34416 type:complete len:341 (-) Transcript_36403:565-1587(-)
MNFVSKIKRFDVYTKPVDGVSEQTTIGAVITFISFCLVTLLLYSEFSAYLKNDIVSHMALDSAKKGGQNTETKIEFDLDFFGVSCERVKFTQEVTRGQHHGDLQMTDINLRTITIDDKEACHAYGSLITDKVGGNFKFEVEALEDKNKELEKENLLDQRALLFFPLLQQSNKIAPDISHRINHILFLDNTVAGDIDQIIFLADSNNKLPLEKHPLNGQVSSVPVGTGIHQYSIQVVPTTYEPIKGKKLLMNQYSVTERQVDFQQALVGVTLAGQYFSNFVGVVFTYDFYPVKLIMQEENGGSMFDFLTSLCGIVGGVITVLGLLEGCIHHSSKALIGKKD